MTEEQGFIMAFDFGLKNIGIAIGQRVTQTSNTCFCIRASNGQPSWPELDRIIKEWQPVFFVLGDPLNMDGTDSEIKKRSKAFGRKIEKRYNKSVELIDERLSTKEAIDRLINSDRSFLFAQNKHSVSAQIILEDWFKNKR